MHSSARRSHSAMKKATPVMRDLCRAREWLLLLCSAVLTVQDARYLPLSLAFTKETTITRMAAARPSCTPV